MAKFDDFFEDFKWEKLGYIRFPEYIVSDFDVKHYGMDKSKDSAGNLKILMNRGFKLKEAKGVISKADRKDYIIRANYELKSLDTLGFCDYLLIIHSICAFAKNTGILSGFGRGSAAGSLVLFLIGVTHTDPIKYNLLFERFVSATRAQKKDFDGETYIESSSLPDVDLDFQQTGKDKIREFIEKRFPGKCGSISNLSKMTGKSLIKETMKAVEEADESSAKIASDLIEKKFGKVEDIEEAIQKNPGFKAWAENHKEVIEVAKDLSDLFKNKSIHASGIILTDNEIDKSVPIELSKSKDDKKGKFASCYDMRDAQKFGIKVDNLGLKTLDVVRKCLENIKMDLYDIDPEDPSAYKYLATSKDYYGLFQIEAGLGEQTVKKIKPKNLEELIACISLGRPGSYKFIDEYNEVKEGKKTPIIDSRLEDILGVTNGILIYQEQIMAICVRMAGFDLKEADTIRSIIGKKKKHLMPEYEAKFKEGSAKNGYDQETVQKIWQTFDDSADYSFNRCLGLDTNVLTPIGYKKITDIPPGDEVISVHNRQKIVTKVKAIHTKASAKLVSLTTHKNKQLTCSYDHKVMNSKGEMQKLLDNVLESNRIITDSKDSND